MPVFNNALAGAAGSTGGGAAAAGFKIERSLRFNNDDAAHLSKSFSSTGNRKTWTWSGWAKLSTLSGGRNLWACYNGTYNIDDFIQFYIGSDHTFIVYVGSSVAWKSNEVFRDPSAWYHFVISFDTTRSNADDILQVWVNGKQLSKASGAGFSLNTDYAVNNNIPHRIGTYNGSSELFDGYMAEIHFLDGIAVTNPDGVFGEFDADTGVWNPIQYTGNYNGPGQKHLGDWVSDTTGSGYNSSHSPDKAFDGSTSTQAAASAGGTLTFTPSTAITGITKVRIFAQRDTNASSATITLNGTDISSNWSLGDNKQVEITTNNLTSLAWTTQSNGQWFGVRTIEIYYDNAYYTLRPGSAPANGFHLDFSDNSSHSALGTDSSGNNNDWTVNNFTAFVTDVSQLPAPANIAYGEGSGTNQTWQNSNSSSATSSALAADYIYWVDLGSNKSFDKVTFDVVASGQSTDTSNNFIVYFSQAHDNLGSSICNNCGITKEATRTGTTPGTISVDFSGFASQTGRYIGITNGHGSAGGTYTYSNFDVAVAADPTQIDSLIDSPTNYVASSGNNGGNYATFNFLDSENGTLSNGNLTTNQTNTSVSFGPQNTTIGVSSGKWYCEFTWDSGIYALVGITHAPSQGKSGTTWHRDADTYTWYFSGAFMSAAWPGTSTFPDGSNPSFTAGDVVGVLLDKDNDKLYFTKNGSYVASMNAATGTNGIDISAHSGETAFFTAGNNASTATQWSLNAGQRPFVLSSLPTGYKSLCTQNLDDASYASIPDGSSHFAASTWTIPSGNADTTVSNLKFGPDWLLLKNRSASSEGSAYDRLLGDDKYLRLFSTNNGNSAATTAATRLNFASDGYVLEGGNDNANYGAGQLGVGWAWNAGTSNTSSSTGSLNSSAYNQSAVWTNVATLSGGGVNSSYPLINGFDSSTSTHAEGDSNNEYLEIPINATIAAGGVRVYAAVTSTNPLYINLYNGSSNVETVTGSNSGGQWYATSTYSGPITKIRIERSGRAWEFNAVEVNGQILVNQGTTPSVSVPSIASTYRANPAAGFSIVKYTGNSNLKQTLAHGLNRVPELIIGKNTGSTYDWSVYTKGTTAAGYLRLNTTDAYTGSTGVWGNEEPTSYSFYVGNDGNNNQANIEHLAYCFAPITGFSSFGVYDGNASGDGPFVYTGFRPAFILLKNQGSGIRSWEVYDSTRDPFNAAERNLLTNNDVGESSGSERVDFLSNGFKIRTSANGINAATPIFYAAFAENPFKIARAR